MRALAQFQIMKTGITPPSTNARIMGYEWYKLQNVRNFRRFADLHV
jgi:hypothetical protein